MNGDTKHPADEDLILYYYEEGPPPAEVEGHLDGCAACRQRYAALRHALAAVTDETAGAAAPFGAAEVERAWATLAPKLGAERRRARVQRWMLPLAMAASLAAAFTLGRRWPAVPEDTRHGAERVLLVAVGDHLERSEMLLLEIVNAPDGAPLDIGPGRTQAEELVGASRLYRAAATRAGEPGVASVLEELERLLVDVAHRPAELSAAEHQGLVRRIESRGLLFKVRVLGYQVREKQKEFVPAGKVS